MVHAIQPVGECDCYDGFIRRGRSICKSITHDNYDAYKIFLTYIKMEPLAFDFQHVHLEHLEQGVCRIAHV